MPTRTSPSPAAMAQLRFEETSCARILYDVYLNMFQHHNIQLLLSELNVHSLQNNSHVRYHRGSFALFLRFVRSRVIADWEKVMDHLLTHIETDSSLITGRNYIQELYLYLHLFKLHFVRTLEHTFNQRSFNSLSKGLAGWKNIPSVVCVTLKVPRRELAVIMDLDPTEISTPMLHCVIESSLASTTKPWHNIFSIIQLSFGDISTSGTRHTDAYEVHIAEDKRRWSGKSALFVSFMAPTWVLLLSQQTARTAFGILSTPHSSRVFFRSLGIEMKIYETTLGNAENVFITKNQLHLPPSAALRPFPNDCPRDSTPNQIAKTVITANVDRTEAKISPLTARLEIFSEDVKAALRNGGKVQTEQVSPYAFIETIGPKAIQIPLEFPVPVLKLKSTTRIARKSSYIEVEAPLADVTSWKVFPEFLCPVSLGPAGAPTLWNMPYLNLDCLPVIDTAKRGDLQWLCPHISGMYNNRERLRRNNSEEDVRTALKDSLFSIFIQFASLRGKQTHLFSLSNPTNGGVPVLVFVSSVKLDITNRTVVLDSAILLLTYQLMPRIRPFLMSLSTLNIVHVKVDVDELRLWKEVLPAMVERSRTWEHGPRCEYQTESRCPLSIENGQTPLCSCGNGQMPSGFISGVPQWTSVSKLFVRATLSLCFPAPFSEELLDVNSIFRDNRPPPAPMCARCGKDESGNGKGLLMCGRCYKVKYCSAECQRADWKGHKVQCKRSN